MENDLAVTAIGSGLLHGLVISVSLGALVGMVRQWADQQAEVDGRHLPGLRTFTLWSVLGYLAAYAGSTYHIAVFPVMLAVFGLALMIFALPVMDLGKPPRAEVGQTSLASGLLTFLAGALIAWGEVWGAVATGAILMIVTATKTVTHHWTERLTRQDIYLFLQFCAVTGLILPLVPNAGYGPMEGFNPYKIWLMVVLISGLGFVGYVATRLLGASGGILVTGIAGGLASSTATTLAFTRASKENPGLSGPLAMGVVIASTIMLGRVWVLIFAINPSLAVLAAVPLALMALPSLLFIGGRMWWDRSRNTSVDAPTLSNPLSLRTAIKFALIYAVVAFLVKLTSQQDTGTGFYFLAFFSGLTDMDAIALSLASEYREVEGSLRLAGQGVVLAAIANTLFKMGFALTLGSPRLRLGILLGMGPVVVVGGVVLFWLL